MENIKYLKKKVLVIDKISSYFVSHLTLYFQQFDFNEI